MLHLARMLKRASSFLTSMRTISQQPYLREATASVEPSLVIKHGQAIAICGGPQRVVDPWIQMVAQTTETNLDWMYRAGYVIVYCLGDDGSRQKAIGEIQKGYPGICIVTILSDSDVASSSSRN